MEEESLGLASLPGRSWLIYFALCRVFAKFLLGLFSVLLRLQKPCLLSYPKLTLTKINENVFVAVCLLNMLDVVVWRYHSHHTVETKKILSIPKHVLTGMGAHLLSAESVGLGCCIAKYKPAVTVQPPRAGCHPGSSMPPEGLPILLPL